ncbi:unnamed protein product [Dimorphilus gyrociliatus]|uniref:Uncharacterized protein n=1 Tax=Dimorphilus gyrociliatus TaxID=2664684 RepID=A0A7I8V6A8_9ANNE|nr:unnamed protein product [Dimorphilus gyrociliatus]
MNEEARSDESDASDDTMIVQDDVDENLDVNSSFYLYLKQSSSSIRNEKCLPIATIKPQIKKRDVNELQKKIEKLVSIKEIHEDSGVETNSNESWEETNENGLYHARRLENFSRNTPISSAVSLPSSSHGIKRTMSDSRLIKPSIKFNREDCYVSSVKTFEVIQRQMSYNEFHRTEFDKIVSSCRQRRINSKRIDNKPKSILRKSQSDMERLNISTQETNEAIRIKETCVDADIEAHCTHAHFNVPKTVKITTIWDRKTGTLSSLV